MPWSFLCCKTFRPYVAVDSVHHLLLPPPTHVCPTPIIARRTQDGLIIQSQAKGCHSSPSSETHNPRSKALGFIDSIRDESAIESLHAKIVKNGGIHDLGNANYILRLYVQFKSFWSARKLFDEMSMRDVKTYTIFISGFARIGSWRLALHCFARMQMDCVNPNAFTLSGVLKSCSGPGLMRMGKSVHGWILRNGVESDAVLENSILDFYLKCGELDSGKRVFDLMGEKSTVSWNVIIAANIQAGEMKYAIDLFRRLPAKDTATWNTIISGHLQSGLKTTALQLLHEMIHVQAACDESTISIALALASSLSLLDLGKQIHAHLIHNGPHCNEFLRASLVDMYSKCGAVDKALLAFKHMSDKNFSRKQYHYYNEELTVADTVSWSCMISGFVQNGMWEQALETFCEMVSEGIKINEFTISIAISGCACSGMLDVGKQIHATAFKSGHELDVVLFHSLVDMYAKCGSLGDAHLLVDGVGERSVVMWTSIISGYAMHGQGKEAVRLFETMRIEGVLPNQVTFVAVLSACSHAGLVEEGCEYFQLMKEVYHIEPEAEHLTCMVDLFGRAGRLDEVKKFIFENGISHLSSVWKAFLSSCRLHKNVEMGKWVAEKLFDLEPSASEPYLLLSDLCASKDWWDDSAKLRILMQTRGINKHPGQSWIQMNRPS